MAQGLTIIYIGNGKGKTSAAAGLAIRAAGTSLKVLYLQFVKGDWPSGEREVLSKLKGVDVKLMGRGFVGILGDRKPIAEHIKAAKNAMAESIKALKSKKYDLVILDEAISAIESDLLTVDDVVKIIKSKPVQTHLCLTGHKRIKKLIDLADLVTEMRMIKHPYYQGILAQRGIDY
ncbi:MAG: cob(I)yrinic acid a,c-diamide adenosyltransferase [Candidatus Doudnabacteria bacterium RIFCSPLOWO2_02_FULL_49_13]|uniref:Cob(I)yrinic acid a,c-diamide adenosyltransferase n=1 Tax=Candidatus Doudnabacteria bacterium RIFCSPHIGHO2_12_FULL_48_16 TaxID=1817838 RepID=A0A1F5PJR8_9BACT|nr:MAG: cob(I)yrinic acid a,c-diamide adenosyltransferase [Candidatus Doudnabacteria bacterium RIFCSPHIGHO2_02_FULL_49_24]OGE89517.1 MAG: cob(I)yrinic acid a,c-diamide adenosyltransferase [Candidatus Doudnabacteria bacterium RIFCSPHIGHO2_01_FULL_50_67]OGE90188.1 MAG: cob(I)yrinic acid a,c-diamide adenosyltransferase [Candidatus Doudnabacteria bacterium RIFCSPHIGHO2_12_FULL_48_16]OGE97729.1 MAG: cob(I)yrinic acid a,c-diamide adenosyltransferase [Candidatus Doudnabacteria bacterium RIFCSPLOWO2_01_